MSKIRVTLAQLSFVVEDALVRLEQAWGGSAFLGPPLVAVMTSGRSAVVWRPPATIGCVLETMLTL